MAKIINNFVRGGVNKDSDERLIPNGSVRDLENAITNASESNDLGTIENVLGNKLISNLDNIPFVNQDDEDTRPFINPVVIGSKEDNAERKIYYFIASDNRDAILEFKKDTNTLSYVILDVEGDGYLNFDKNKRITHINIINKSSTSNDPVEDSDLLAWCGDDNPPRIINIERLKQSPNSYLEEDINVIKPQPEEAPEITPLTLPDEGNGMDDRFYIFAYRYKYEDGFYSAISSATENLFTPSNFNINFDTFENEGMVNIYNACDIHFNTGSGAVTDVELLFKESTTTTWRIIETLNKKDEGWLNGKTETFRFKNNKNYRVLPDREYFRSFDNVPLSSVTQEYAEGRLFYFNYKEQRNLTDFNGDKVELKYTVDVNSDNFQNTLLFTSGQDSSTTGGSGNAFLLIDFNGITEIKKDSRIDINFNIGVDDTETEFNDLFSYVFNEDLIATTSENLILQLKNNNDFNQALEQFRLSFVENGFNEPINTVSSDTTLGDFQISPNLITDSGVLAIQLPRVIFTFANGGSEINIYKEKNSIVNINNFSSASSMKSIRDYEVAMIFMDKEGRKTTALTSQENTVNIPVSASDKKNVLKVDIPIGMNVPKWADRYKFAVKKVGLWETFYSNRFYIDGGFRWIKLEGGDINKVNVGDDIIVKKDSTEIQDTLGTVKVLDIVDQDRDFIPDNTVEGTDTLLEEEQGQYIKIRPEGFSLDYADNEFINIDRADENASNVSSERPYVILDNFKVETTGAGGAVVFEDLPFNQGTIFDIIKILSRNDDDQSLVKKTFVSNVNYANIHDFLTGMNTYVPDNAPDPSQFPDTPETPYPTGFFETENDDDDYIAYWIVRGEVVPISDSGGSYLIDESGSPLLVSDSNFDNAPLTNYKVRLDDTKPYVMVIKGSEAGNGNNRGKLDIRINIRVVDGYYVFETKEKPVTDEIFFETPETFFIYNPHRSTADYPQQEHLLSRYFNCYTQGNGAESYQYKDKFNANHLDVDYTPTGVSDDEYRQLDRFSDITWSGVFNDNAGVNGLNEFNLSLANFKDDIENSYGGGYRLYARDTDLVLFQEDKVSYVRVGESELFNSDSTSNITRIDNVLGNQVAYIGEYGIAKDTDCFAFYGNSLYFTDRKRGVVCRLSNNGIFEISSFGMSSYFRNLFRETNPTLIIGEWDDFTNAYVLNIKYNDTYETWYYKEAITEAGGGWISRQTFNPDDMVSMNGNLYSFKGGNVYEHNIRESGNYNTFYGVSSPSKVSFVFNQEALNRKNYKTIEIDGSDSWDINLNTNLQNGHINKDDFLLQEGIYRFHVKGDKNNQSIDTASLHIQGIGELLEIDDNDSLIFNNINEEVSIGDILYNDELSQMGVITDINRNELTLDNISPDLNIGDFMLSSKPQSIETSGLLGYFMRVDMELDKTDKTELFAVASEVFLSAPNTQTQQG